MKKTDLIIDFSRQVNQKIFVPTDVLSELIRIGKRLHSLDEKSCNGESGTFDERKEENLLIKANKILEEYHFRAYHQSDPRGWSLYIYRDQDLRGYPIDADYNSVAIGVPLL